MFSNDFASFESRRAALRSSKLKLFAALMATAALCLPTSVAVAGEVSVVGTIDVHVKGINDVTFDTASVNPEIREGSDGEWAATTFIRITPPAGFLFNPAQPVTGDVVVGDIDIGGGAGGDFAETPTPTLIEFQVNAASGAGGASTIRFLNIQLRATVCGVGTLGAANPIRVDLPASTPSDDPLVNVNVVNDISDLDHFDLVAVPPTQVAGTDILVTLTARDFCGNAIDGGFTVPAGTPIVLTATGGAGIRTYSNGTLAVTPTVANTAEIQNPEALDANAQGTFNVQSPVGEDADITITATLGPASGTVIVHWITATCTGVAPASEVNLVGTGHTVTATIQRNGVNVVDGTIVNFTIVGVNAGGPFARPTTGGVATLTYTSNGTAGFDTISASGSVDGVPYTTACLAATKEWITSACSLAPPTDSNAVGTSHTATVTVLRNGLPTNGINVTFSILAGSPNDAEPDQVIMTAGAGTADFTYTSNGTPGTDTIQATGAIDGVPFTCTATKTWIDAQCLLLPAADTNPINTLHTVTVTVSRDGSPVPAGQLVNFEITAGPNAPFGPIPSLTDVFGQAQFSYPGLGGTGTDDLRTFGTISGVNFECFAAKTWVDAQCSLAPPAETNQVGTDHTVTVTVLRNGAPVPDGTVVDFNILPGSPNVGGPFPRLVAGGAGQASFTYTGSLTPGVDTIQASGVTADGVPLICTAVKTWINVACSLAPPAAVHLVSPPDQSVTATVSVNGVPVAAGQPVDFAVLAGGANFGAAGTVNTVAGGTATFTYTGANAGTDTIRASGTVSGVAFECTATKEWVDPSCSIPASLGPKPRGANHTVTVTVLRRAGSPAVGVPVTFNVLAGPNAGVASPPIATNASGEASFIYLGANAPTPGNDTDTIQASATVEGQLTTCSTTQQWIESGCAVDLTTPTTVTSQVGTAQTVTVTVLQNGVPAVGVAVNLAVTGVNAFSDADITDPLGQAAFTYTSNGTPGNDTITASGSISGVPFTCFVNKTWVMAQINLTPLNSTNQIGTSHTVTGTVRLNGIPQVGVNVAFDVTGVNPTAGADVTDVNGEATFAYTGNNTGADVITATATVSGVPVTATANKTWVEVTCSLDPPTDTNPVGTAHSVEITLLNNGAFVNGNNVTFAVIAGPNFGVVGAVSGATGSTGAGQATFTYTSNGNIGTDTIRASGSAGGVPYECIATKNWIATSCTVTPPSQQAPISANASVTATIIRNGLPAVGVPITFNVTGGPNVGANGVVPTNVSGQAVFTYLGGPVAGTDTIAVSGTVDGVPLTCNNATVQRVTTGCTLTPPNDVNALNSPHTVTVEVLQNAAPVAGLLVGFEVISGPNMGNTGFGFTNALGRATFTYTGDGGLGTDTIRASGMVGPIPFNCVATKEWINATCDIAPATSTNPVGSNHTATVTVLRNGAPAAAVPVTFTITAGPNAGLVAPRVTDGLGEATLLYTSNGTVGVDTIQVTGLVDGVPILCTATKTWITAACSLAPPTDTNQENTQHTVTVTTTRNGAPAAGINVTYNVIAGPNTGLILMNVTNGAGQSSFTYTGSGGVGTDTIQATGVIDGIPIVCTATKVWIEDDEDGIDPGEEDDAPNGGDGNSDGIPDSLQDNVASFRDVNGNFVTLVAPPGTKFVDVKAIEPPGGGIPPPDVVFPSGFFSWKLTGFAAGVPVTVTMILHSEPAMNTFYKFGPTPIIPLDHFYSFLYDGTTGAVISGKIVTLYFVDGQRGDHDLTANGIIVEPGAPALQSDNPSPIRPAAASCGLCGAVGAMSLVGMVVGMVVMRGGRRRRRLS